MISISKLIKEKRLSNGLTQVELAEKVGVTSVAVSKWELGLVKPKPSHCRLLGDVLGINHKTIMGISSFKTKGYTEVPFLDDICAAAGSGCIVSKEIVNDYVMLPIDALGGSQKKDIVCIKASGDSMLPVLNDGALLALDTSIQKIKDGTMYVISYDGMLRVKVLSNALSGIRLHSFNPMYQDELLSLSDLDTFKVIGKVIWYSVNIK
ncbi:LexA family transcriptional regulator [Photobacterium leiognathi]|uniref:LexA family transcriptional regulator n=1 Tax=Photobacterium leiognathi TaxID=553611 RepID=UPI0027397ED1|nr:S24 family peptidase [Photobacterium leiognathi]